MNSDDAVRHGPSIGIVGAGQLARMTLPEAVPLGIDLRLLAERGDDSAALVAKHVALGAPDSITDLRRFAQTCDVLTFDHELVNAAALRDLMAEGHVVRPSADVVALVQDKRLQREAMRRLELPIPAYELVTGIESFSEFGSAHGWPVVAKATRGGYDGRGVWILDDVAAAEDLVSRTGAQTSLLVEAWIPIEREIAALIARRPSGQTALYPLVETLQVDGICRELIVPARVPDHLVQEAHQIATTVAEAIGLEGLLAVELFVSEGRLVVNELAARPHNSGHFSIEGCRTSQFAQHLRAILDWPLGDTRLTAPAVATVNVLGDVAGIDPRSRIAQALTVPDCYPHVYGKAPRPGRKLGHVTALGDDQEETLARARRSAALLIGGDV